MQNEIITFTSPKASVSEVFRTLRTNVQFMNASSNKKSILFTSIQAGDGKSWVSANLATAFAQAGKRVILVDTDMRRGRQHEIFEVPNNKGLSNYLILSTDKPEEKIGEYIKPTMVENLYLITAGVVPPNPSELLTSKKMTDLIEILENMADIVIFDSTPSTMVTDAMAISRYVGTTIIVASQKKSKMDLLKQIKKNIENVGGRVGGIILNKAPISRKEYGKSYYYESSVVVADSKNKKFDLTKIFSKNDSKIHKGVEDKKIEEVKQKLDEVDKENTIKDEKKTEETEDNKEELNVLLKQLTKYLETK